MIVSTRCLRECFTAVPIQGENFPFILHIEVLGEIDYAMGVLYTVQDPRQNQN